MVNYSNSIIYKLVCNDTNITDIYIGSTTCFARRKNQHKTNCNSVNNENYNRKVYQFIRDNGGFQNWDMIQIEQVECKTKRDLESKERHWIETLKSTLNKIIPTRTKKEWINANKDELKEYKKEWHQNNKDKLKESRKEYFKNYRDTNKDEINKKVICDCGKSSRISNIIRHKQSKPHIFYEKTYNFIIS